MSSLKDRVYEALVEHAADFDESRVLRHLNVSSVLARSRHKIMRVSVNHMLLAFQEVVTEDVYDLMVANMAELCADFPRIAFDLPCPGRPDEESTIDPSDIVITH
jgi:hypothetical protein